MKIQKTVMLKSRIFIVIFLLSFSFLYAQKKYEWKTATVKGYTYRYVTNDPLQTRFYTLQNGLMVMLSVNHIEPRIAYRMAVRTGSNNDPKDHNGLAHYLEHLLFKGTDKYGTLDWAKEKPYLDSIDILYEQYNSTNDTIVRRNIYREIDRVSGIASHYSIAGEYAKMMTSIGSQGTNAHTWVEETMYEEDIPSNAIDKFLTVQAERFRNPVFRIFHTELEAVYEEKNRSLDNDGAKMGEAMNAALFPTHNYGQQTTIGSVEHLKNPSIKAIREYYYKFYVPNNMAIVMAGDFDPDQLIKKIDLAFAYMKPKPVENYQGPKEAPIAGPVVKEVNGPGAENMRIVYRSAQSDTREAFLADLLSNIFSNGKAGLIDINLNKQQKVLGGGASLSQFKDYGIFMIAASPKQGQTLLEVKDLLLQQVNILKKGDFDGALIKAIAANNKLSMLQGLEDNGNRASNIADEFIKNRGMMWNKTVGDVDEMAKVSKKEIVDFANKFLGDDNYVVLYKRKGVDNNIVKVEKPPITPVETNADKSSSFEKLITETPVSAIKPVWIDYDKDLQKTKLGNAEVLYVQNKENGIFRLAYRFDMGSWNNKLIPVAGRYLQYLGTDKYTAEAISKEFYKLACSFSINTGADQTMVTISGLQENFTKAVALFEELLHHCKPDTAALNGLNNLMQKSRANNKLNKNAIASALQSYAVYGPQNPYNYVLTDKELQDLKAVDLTDLLHSLTNNPHKISYYGPRSLDELKNDLKNIHQLPLHWNANSDAVQFERVIQTHNQVLFSNYDAVQAEIYWVRNLDKYDSKSEAVINVFNNYFGNGFGSVVFQNIRESKALAYSTYASVITPSKKDDKFRMAAYVGCQADKMNAAVAGMNELLNHLPENKQNLENVRKSLLKNTETERITKDDIIASYLNSQRKGLDYDIRKESYKKYNSIRMDDLKQYHQQYLANQPYTYCVIASDKKINPDDLKKYGEVKIVSLTELFGY